MDTTKVQHGFQATMTALPGKGDAVLALLLGAPALPHPDCLVFLVGRSATDPDVLQVSEGWVSEAAHREFRGSAAAQDFVAALIPLLDGESRYQDQVPVGGKAAFRDPVS